MSGPEPNAETLLFHVRMEHILAVAGLAWPFALTAWAVLLHWRRLRSRLGFLVSGVLACFGVQAFLARLTRYVFWTYFALEPHTRSMAVHLTDPIVIIVASAGLSVPLLIWLAALLGLPPTPPAGGNNDESAKSPATKAPR
jgi:hypothetical protein